MKPTAQRYYSSGDIQTILGCSKGYANQIMHMFDTKGAVIRLGRSMRVEVNAFELWLLGLKGVRA